VGIQIDVLRIWRNLQRCNILSAEAISVFYFNKDLTDSYLESLISIICPRNISLKNIVTSGGAGVCCYLIWSISLIAQCNKGICSVIVVESQLVRIEIEA